MLALIGPDYQFHTTVESNGALDKHGRLTGDLVLDVEGADHWLSGIAPALRAADVSKDVVLLGWVHRVRGEDRGAGNAQGLLNVLSLDLIAGKTDDLIESALRVAHEAFTWVLGGVRK